MFVSHGTVSVCVAGSCVFVHFPTVASATICVCLFLFLFVCLYHIVVAHCIVSVAGPCVCVDFPTVASAGLNVISSVVGHRQQLIIG